MIRLAWTFFLLASTVASFSSCASPGRGTQAEAQPLTDPTRQPEYLDAINRLTALNSQAEEHFTAGRRQEAAALVAEGGDLAKKLLAVSRPNLPAMEAVSDREELYAELLFANRHYAHARQMNQRNLARWKLWLPQTDETRRRYSQAASAIARCDEALAAP
ncbi:MAG: hypothetical protein KIT83_14740 [Bryobacterales bacterium]|nr:hypothetical protein [Bryobacterales bacterium]